MDNKPKRKERSKLSRQLFLGIALIMSITYVIIIVSIVNTDISDFLFYLKKGFELSVIADQTENIILENIENPSEFVSLLTKLEKTKGIFYEIYEINDEDSAERLLYTTFYKNDYPPAGGYYDKSHEMDFFVKDVGGITANFIIQRRIDTSDEVNKLYIVLTQRINEDYRIEIFSEQMDIEEQTTNAIIYSFIITAIMIIIMLIAAQFYSKSFAKPIIRISDITKKLSKLDFSEKCPPSRTREIDSLSFSINEMSETLDTALRDLQEKNQRLQDDIEKERTLEQLRTSFITNVSHELKTPIAIIQGYAEGLMMYMDSDDIEKAKKYSNVIINETKGMHAMVMKLLEILKYDSGDYKAEKELFNVFDLVEDWFTRNTNILGDKNITYENLIDRQLFAYGDVMLLSSVVNNYLSNAVSHVSGERKLRAWFEERGELVRIFIFNSGERISNKDIDNIWLSFYRADKAMSRAEGRFGLGLSIVKAIQRIHDCECGVYNDKNGVTFWFDIKLNKI